jgi:hypothetical protein
MLETILLSCLTLKHGVFERLQLLAFRKTVLQASDPSSWIANVKWRIRLVFHSHPDRVPMGCKHSNTSVNCCRRKAKDEPGSLTHRCKECSYGHRRKVKVRIVIECGRHLERIYSSAWEWMLVSRRKGILPTSERSYFISYRSAIRI